MNAPLSESTQHSLEVAAELLDCEDAHKVVNMIYHLGYLDCLLDMAKSQAARFDQTMKEML